MLIALLRVAAAIDHCYVERGGLFIGETGEVVLQAAAAGFGYQGIHVQTASAAVMALMLATAPGGIAEMAITANVLQLGVGW